MKKKVLLDRFLDVKEFVNFAQYYGGEVTVRHGKYAVDGKSILGVFSLDLTQVLEVEYTEEDFGKAIEKFEVSF